MERSRLSQSSFGSPVKTSQVKKLEDDKKYILKKLHYLFVVYASRASRYSYREINEKSFMELMTDAYHTKGFKLIKNSEAWKKIATLYYGKGKKSSMDYESFLKLLPGISELFSKSQTSEDGLKLLLKHMMIVYE
jgi:coproporphyrinogen III oxidase-like Fe-S oxidoreductase